MTKDTMTEDTSFPVYLDGVVYDVFTDANDFTMIYKVQVDKKQIIFSLNLEGNLVPTNASQANKKLLLIGQAIYNYFV